MARRTDGDRGSFALELAAVAPVLLLVVAFVISVGRITEARAQVQQAARDTVRASTINHAGNARAAASAAFAKATAGMDCDQMALDPDQPGPGQVVTATVTCHVRTLWQTQTVTRTAQSVADVYRGVD
jgi:Flp pilus assembly protein TadG